MTVKVPSKSGGEFSAYVALPLRPGPAIVVVQEIFGANANIRSICDFLASRQFVAIAPDFYWRTGEGIELDPATDTEKARAIRAKTDDNLASDDAADDDGVHQEASPLHGPGRRRRLLLGRYDLRT